MSEQPTKIRVVSIETLMDMWEKDCVMSDNMELESQRTPTLHSKYNNIRATHSLMAKKADTNYKKEYLWYWRYYMGKNMEKEEVEKRNPEIGQNESVLKNHVDAYIQGEDALTKIAMIRTVHDEIVNYCKEILIELKQRTYQIKNILEERRFNAGS